MKSSIAPALAFFLALTTSHAQVFTPNSTGSQSSGSSSNSSNSSSQSSQQGNDPIMGNVLPLFDPSTETVLFEGQLWDINDNRLFNARFEKYLNSPPADSEADRAYRSILEDIRRALSPHNLARGGRTDLQRAVALLESAATYPQDGRMCEAIANAIYRVWLARREVASLEGANRRLREDRRYATRSYEMTAKPAKTSRRQDDDDSSSAAEDAAVAAGVISRAGEYATRYAEIQAKITANEGKIALSEVESKLEFQALLVQLFIQRRFEHVIIAARIYTEFYEDGSGRIEFKDGSDAEKSFKEIAGFDPTVTTLDTLSNEAIRDTDQAIEAFHFLIEKDERASASKRLMEAYIVGEFLPAVQTVSLEKKQSILQFVKSYNQLLSSLEVKDYGLAEEKVDELRTLARDFDHSKPAAAINTARLSSNMHIQTAVNEMLQGNKNAYQQNIAAAASIWPTNPKLKEATDLVAEQGNVQIQTVNDLDRLIATRSYRQIFEDQGRYIAAVVNDSQRSEQLRGIITNITKIDIAIQQAEKLAQVGNRFGAWETVEEVFQDFPDDPPLSKARSDYATSVAPFVSALKKAEDLEDRRQTGSSLAWFLKARQMYPASTFAARGIQRLTDRLVPDQEGIEDSLR